jgi:hypothetical protein
VEIGLYNLRRFVVEDLRNEKKIPIGDYHCYVFKICCGLNLGDWVLYGYIGYIENIVRYLYG